MFSRSAYIRRTSAHLRLVLAVLLAVYVYRDVWPLATYTLHPQDSNEGLILPLKIALLVLGAIVIPLSTDRQYTPVDPRVSFSLQRPYTMLITKFLATHGKAQPGANFIVVLNHCLFIHGFNHMACLSGASFAIRGASCFTRL